jgi:hypothetical protein
MYFLGQPFDSEVYHQAPGLEEYHSNRQCDSDALLPTSLILNQGERVITNKIVGHFVEPAKSYS